MQLIVLPLSPLTSQSTSNPCNATRTIPSPSVSETVSIWEMYLWYTTKDGREPVTYSILVSECVSHSVTGNLNLKLFKLVLRTYFWISTFHILSQLVSLSLAPVAAGTSAPPYSYLKVPTKLQRNSNSELTSSRYKQQMRRLSSKMQLRWTTSSHSL